MALGWVAAPNIVSLTGSTYFRKQGSSPQVMASLNHLIIKYGFQKMTGDTVV
jgi:hypothetical protein